MEISRFNSEGYHDPTTYEALSKIRKEELAEKRAYRPLVYICSPLAGDMDGNMEKARRTANLRCEAVLSRSPRTCCFRSLWMTRTRTNGRLPCS